MIKHAYIHVPFCPRICPYCNFYVVPADRSLSVPLVESLCRESEWWRGEEELRFETVYFGGGTPSALDTRSLKKLIGTVLSGQKPVEVSLEVNPTTLSLEKAIMLLELGVNRISLGAQSFNDYELRTLGRQHSAERIVGTYEILRKAGFSNINIDLIFGTPGGTLESWKNSLHKALSLNPEHISAYCLTYEEDTPFFENLTSGRWKKPNTQDEADFYKFTQDELIKCGFLQYEVSNYCRGDSWSVHNRAYWRGEDYLGFGPGAVSTIRGIRWKNRANVRSYIETEVMPVARDEVECLSDLTLLKERLMLGLRTCWGVEIPEVILPFFRKLHDEELAYELAGKWCLTPKGLRLADGIAEEVFSLLDNLS